MCSVASCLIHLQESSMPAAAVSGRGCVFRGVACRRRSNDVRSHKTGPVESVDTLGAFWAIGSCIATRSAGRIPPLDAICSYNLLGITLSERDHRVMELPPVLQDHPGFVVILVSLAGCVANEFLSWLLVYRRDRYKYLKGQLLAGEKRLEVWYMRVTFPCSMQIG